MKYHIVQLGCQMNISDGERVQKVLDQLGFEYTDREEEANLLGVIACSVRQKAIDKVYSRIQRWNKWKNKKNLITFVTGCVLPADREKFLKIFDLVFPISELPSLPDMIYQYGIVSPAAMQSIDNGLAELEAPVLNSRNEAAFRLDEVELSPKKRGILNPEKGIEEFWHVIPKYGSGFEAYIPIQNGCNKFCTYCAVPYTRGREVSRPSSEIMKELHHLVESGFKSITLLGQNVNSYGLDKNGEEVSFAQLLRLIGEYGNETDAKFWLYFTSPHPRDMSDEIIEVISQYNCLAKQIHLPIQSGDDEVLIRMNRKHTVEQYRHIVSTIRRLIPQATLFTDIIVGFTGETNEQHENTRKAIAEFKYNMAYIAQYSPRPGAASSRWEDDIPKDEKKLRFRALTDELIIHSFGYNNKLVGKTMDVLVRGKDRKSGYLSGLTEGKIIVRFPSDNTDLIGQFVKVKIHSAASFSTEGERVDSRVISPAN